MVTINLIPEDKIKPYYQDDAVVIYCVDCRDILLFIRGVSAVVTDPPYELSFMGKPWDSRGISFQSDIWQLIRQACLPGAMLLSFGGTRTFHKIAVAIEDAGWQIRDTIMWVYGSGFPKSLDISKAIDKKAGQKPIILGKRTDGRYSSKFQNGNNQFVNAENNKRTEVDSKIGLITIPATPEAKLWDGYGTALKPAYEPIILAMNPIDGTFANNALKYGVAGLNISECRIDYASESDKEIALAGDAFKRKDISDRGWSRPWMEDKVKIARLNIEARARAQQGRFPANFIHDGSQEVMELFPNTKSGKAEIGIGKGRVGKNPFSESRGGKVVSCFADSGSAARFFYCAKASRAERDAGLEDMPLGEPQRWNKAGEWTNDTTPARNNHPTVKPLALMTYLCKLVKMPEYNLILDPFCGSGTTLLACKKLGILCIGIDNDEEACEIAAKRCSQEVMRLNI